MCRLHQLSGRNPICKYSAIRRRTAIAARLRAVINAGRPYTIKTADLLGCLVGKVAASTPRRTR
jgi:hypothetical protein